MAYNAFQKLNDNTEAIRLPGMGQGNASHINSTIDEPHLQRSRIKSLLGKNQQL